MEFDAKIHVNTASAAYYISIRQGYENLAKELKSAGITTVSACIVTDANVSKLYLSEITALLSNYAKNVFCCVLPAGEGGKSLLSVKKIYNFLCANDADKSTLIFALGGGVVGDLAGFAASTFMRGIRIVHLPTTIIAMCDSSVGGKTGYDYNGKKNFIGSFHQPKLVYANLRTVETLSEREFRSGMAEVIKYAVACDASFFEFLSKEREGILLRSLPFIYKTIVWSCRIKSGIVEEDEFDSSGRLLLNFGHTVGHALEAASEYLISHGEAVALGMRAELYMSEKRGLIAPAETARVKELLEFFSLPVKLKKDTLDMERIIKNIRNDKKSLEGRVRCVFAKKIGKSAVDFCTENEIIDSINCLFGE